MKCSGIGKRDTVSCADAQICPPACMCTDTIVDCRDRGLAHIPSNLPGSTSELRLEQNQITFIPSKAFHNMGGLKRLVLYGNNLTDLPIEAFHGLENLQLLLLNANQLQCIRRGTFDPLTKLNLLSLYDNQIKSISNATFHKLPKLQTLHLARNPLICDCNMVRSFSRFLKKNIGKSFNKVTYLKKWLAELQEARGIETVERGVNCQGG
ncbi:LRRNT [Parelaphostrongylus tenuis]|uniref:LRRNT n=1 Tax=Parelaphostrongylus tenuis TaxID=148309 RepID=A0AAD5M2U8_PARTN|nr:LRRNT [Parelaphostrongylus tenuis]